MNNAHLLLSYTRGFLLLLLLILFNLILKFYENLNYYDSFFIVIIIRRKTLCTKVCEREREVISIGKKKGGKNIEMKWDAHI